MRRRLHAELYSPRTDAGEIDMTRNAHRQTNLTRLTIAGAFLLAGLGATAHAASAAPSLADTGGPGCGPDHDTGSMMIEQAGLVPTNDGPTVASEGPTLVGSGPERETVANTTVAGTLDESERSQQLIAMSGDSSVAGTLDESERSQELIAMSGDSTASSDASDDITDTTARSRGLPF